MKILEYCISKVLVFAVCLGVFYLVFNVLPLSGGAAPLSWGSLLARAGGVTIGFALLDGLRWLLRKKKSKKTDDREEEKQ